MKLKFLAAAQAYALERGDDDWFCEVYNNYRPSEDIHESTWLTLAYLYGNEVANQIERESKPAFV